MKFKKIVVCGILVVLVLGTISIKLPEETKGDIIPHDHEALEVELDRRAEDDIAWKDYLSHKNTIGTRIWDEFGVGDSHPCIYNHAARHFTDEIPGACLADVWVEFVPVFYKTWGYEVGSEILGGTLGYYIFVKTQIDSGDSIYMGDKPDQDVYPLLSPNLKPLRLKTVKIDTTINADTNYWVDGDIWDEGSSVRFGTYAYDSEGYRGNHWLFTGQGEANYDNNYETWVNDLKETGELEEDIERLIDGSRDALYLAGSAAWLIQNFWPPAAVVTYTLTVADAIAFLLESIVEFFSEDEPGPPGWDMDAQTNKGDDDLLATWDYPMEPAAIVGSTHWTFNTINIWDFKNLDEITVDIKVTVDIADHQGGAPVVGSDDETFTIHLTDNDWTPPAAIPPPSLKTPTTITSSSVTLSWDDTGATSYGIAMRKTMGDILEHGLAADYTTTDNEITIEGLDPYTTYYFKIVGEYESNVVSATTEGTNGNGWINYGGDGSSGPTGSTGGSYKPGESEGESCEGEDGEMPPQGGGHGCPYSCIWNGTNFSTNNNIVPFSEDFFRSTEETTDYLMLNNSLVSDSTTTYSIRIIEKEVEYTNIDKISLMTVDHLDDFEVGMAQNGSIHAYQNLTPPENAYDKMGRQKKSDVNTTGDDEYYKGGYGDFLIVDFGHITFSDTAKVVIVSDYKDEEFIVHYSQTVHGYPTLHGPITVEFLDTSSNWIKVTDIMPRDLWAEDVVDLSSNISQFNNSKLTLKLTWKGLHIIDFIGLSKFNTSVNLSMQTYQPIRANHSVSGNITNKLLNDDNQFAQIRRGEHIDIEFPYIQPPPNTTRDFVLVSKGYYWFPAFSVNASQDVNISINTNGTIGNSLEVLVLEKRRSPRYLHGVIAKTSMAVTPSGTQDSLTFRAYAERNYSVRLRYRRNLTNAPGISNATLTIQYNNITKIKNVTFNNTNILGPERTINITADVHENLYEYNYSTVYAKPGDNINLELDNVPDKSLTFSWTNMSWDFGDNTTYNSTINRIATHNYTSTGTYSVKITVTYEDGTTIMQAKDIIVI